MKYNWGIVGTGWIAHEMGQALKNVNGTIYGVCSGKIANAQKFADEFNVEHIYQVCRKAPCFSTGDIRHVRRICVSN